MNGPTKAHLHPFGSTVIPHNGELAVGANKPKLPGSPSPIPGSMGVAGAPMLRNLSPEPQITPTSAITKALDDLFEALADRVADKVIAKIGASTKAAPDVEDLNRTRSMDSVQAVQDYDPTSA